MDTLMSLGIPSAIASAIIGIFVWWFKKDVEKREAERVKREENTEQLMLLSLQSARATLVLATATAKAVQRIPDAHCNGDMTEALAKAAEIQQAEKDFLFDQGVKHIFGD